MLLLFFLLGCLGDGCCDFLDDFPDVLEPQLLQLLEEGVLVGVDAEVAVGEVFWGEFLEVLHDGGGVVVGGDVLLEVVGEGDLGVD